MFMVVMLHILGQGGLLGNTTILSSKYEIAWLMEIACYCAVDCYAIISGYVMCNSKIKYSNLLMLWMQVIIYSLGITVFMDLFTNCVISKGLYLNAIFPVLSRQYWYFIAYFGMFLFLPFLNKFINNLDKNEMKRLFCIIVLFITILPIIFQWDSFKMQGGYNAIWLGMLYIVGAYIKKYVDLKNISIHKCLIVYLICILGLWANKYLIEFLTMKLFSKVMFGDIFIQYNSIFVVILATALFLFFVNLNIRNIFVKKLIKILSPLSFSVYLIHCQPLIFSYFLKEAFIPYIDNLMFIYILYIILTAIVIYTVCSCIDCVRLYMFNKFNIKQRCCDIVENVEEKLTLLFNFVPFK